MADPLGDPPPNADPGASPGDNDALNLFDGSADPTDDSPTVISKAPKPNTSIKTEENFTGSLRGRRLAHFELIEPIGVGGMAAVLRARDTQLDRLVALKILPPEMASDAENIRRFHQEARSAAKLDHENIARVFFCGEDQRLHFIAFEFVEGDNLRNILEKRGRLPVGEALNYMLQVAAGLAHASCRGVVHRDIKPSNIIITPNGRAKLVDMGLARSLEPQHDMGLTQSGVTLGTFDYISPEQALEPRDADVRSDIYSLGCTFYHMLTGQPPVPEGTAAKKLHHHQHVKPVDPRQFVPDLPDEAAIILDRMMAKQPKDRYQTPEQLVHHLYLAARKLGAAAEVPEGVLAVEAAMPNPPAGRPFVLAALAAVAVIGLIFLIDQLSAPKADSIPGPQITRKSDGDGKESSGSPPTQITPRLLKDDTAKPVKTVAAEASIPTFKSDKPTAAELADFLHKNREAKEIDIVLADDLDSRGRDDREPDLVISNPTVTIRAADPRKRPTVRYDYHDRPSTAMQAALTIESKICTVEGLRFVLDQRNAESPMASLFFRGVRGVRGARYRVRNCEFIQGNPVGKEQNRMTSVLAESREPGALVLEESCFLGFSSLSDAGGGNGGRKMVFGGAASGGQDAVTRRGPVRVEATNCVFGPHAATFRVEGEAPDEDVGVSLTHCSVLAAGQSAVFDVTDGADARLGANFSLFSHPGDPAMTGMAEGKGAVLVRLASTQGNVEYKGHDNRYHQLDSYVAVVNAMEEAAGGMLEQIKRNDDSLPLTTSPWKAADPLDLLKNLAIRDAFEVNAQLPELRVPAGEKAGGRLLGAEKALAFSYVENLAPLKPDVVESSGRRELVVEKRAQPDLARRIYPALRDALLVAQPGDVIVLRLDGEVKLDPLDLSGAKLANLTIRADKNFHPILALKEADEDPFETALFALHSGKLHLEDLEIRLRPGRDDYDSQAVVSLPGDGECELKNCLVTLDRGMKKTALSVAVLTTEPAKRKKNATQLPRFTLENCVVRGQGDLIWSRGGQPAELTIKNSLVALSGSLLNAEGDKDLPGTDVPLIVTLKKVTTYLGGNLIRFRAGKDIKSLAVVQCRPEDCLFLPAADRALVHLEGPESEERGLPEKLFWEHVGKNAYGGFTTLLEQQSIGSMMMMPSPSKLEDWKDKVSGETESDYNVKLPSPPAADTAFAQLLPPAFRTDEKLKDYGADIASLRKIPPLRGKSEIRDPKAELFGPDFD
jgi:serine/threonine protein kinase